MQKDVSGEKLASILKSGPEIKNRCTKEGVNRQNPASIRKSGPEIKNHCTKHPKPTAPEQARIKKGVAGHPVTPL